MLNKEKIISNIFYNKLSLLKFKKSNIYLLLDELINTLLNFLLSIIIVKILSLEAFGLYVPFMVTIFLANTLQYSLISTPILIENQYFSGMELDNFYKNAFTSVICLLFFIVIITYMVLTMMTLFGFFK